MIRVKQFSSTSSLSNYVVDSVCFLLSRGFPIVELVELENQISRTDRSLGCAENVPSELEISDPSLREGESQKWSTFTFFILELLSRLNWK